MARAAKGTFPPAAALLSRSWWYAWDHPVPVILLGLGGAVPVAAMFLLFLQEAHEATFLGGTSVRSLRPAALILSALYMARYPFRMALARWMALARRGEGSIPQAVGWSLLHLPTSLFYGSYSTLGWLAGTVTLVPFFGTFHANLACHRFAARSDGALSTLRAASRVPILGISVRLLSLCQLVCLVVFLVVWTGLPALLGLCEWLLRSDVAALRSVIRLASAPWAAAGATVALLATGLLWTVAFGLLWEHWEELSEGGDLSSRLAVLEAGGGAST